MPYLRITGPDLDPGQRRAIAAALTDAINNLLYNPRSPITRQDLRERTTVHFAPYGEDDLFIGGRTPAERGAADLTIELSDWNMSVRQRRRLAAALTPTLARRFDIPTSGLGGINIRFHPSPPTDFAVGRRLLSDLVPWIGRVFRHLAP